MNYREMARGVLFSKKDIFGVFTCTLYLAIVFSKMLTE